jgi:hypothetical protein
MPPGDELDQLLGSFFRSEMPDPWPSFQPPLSRALTLPDRSSDRSLGGSRSSLLLHAPEPMGARDRRPFAGRLFRSRVALAASIALLLGGLWALGGMSISGMRGPNLPSLQPGEATHRGLPAPIPAETEPPPAEKVKSSLSLQQSPDGRTGIRIITEEIVPGDDIPER